MSKQYLTFTLAGTVYAVNVFHVREVLPYSPPQALPKSDPIIEGLIRSREQSIPVINLRRKLALGDKEADNATRIIVVEVNNYEEGSIAVFGAVADSVNEVLDLDTIGFEDTPELGNSPASAFIEGIGRQDDAFIIILDVDKIFSNPELSEMSELDNRTVAPEYAQYTQELPQHRHESEAAAPHVEEEPAQAEDAAAKTAQAEEAPQAEAREETAEEARPDQVLPAIKTPPSPLQPLEEEPAQEAALEQEPPQEEEAANPETPEKPRAKEKASPSPEDAAARYDALNYAPEDFELL